jgi:hypothetical protein
MRAIFPHRADLDAELVVLAVKNCRHVTPTKPHSSACTRSLIARLFWQEERQRGLRHGAGRACATHRRTAYVLTESPQAGPIYCSRRGGAAGRQPQSLSERV